MDIISEYQSEFKPEVTASEIVESNMNKYARHVLLEVLPNHIDGLKLIHRRILMALGAAEDKVKGVDLVGRVMGKYHPHGDASIYDAIIRLAQPFNQVYPFVKVYGNVGNYSGEAAAAARYTDITSAEFSRDIFFNKTNFRTLTFIPSEIGRGTEPAYFIPAIPTALLTGAHTIAVGVKSIVPYLELANICVLVEKFVTLRKEQPLTYQDKLSSLVKYLIPDMPTHSLLRNETVLLNDYAKGIYSTSMLMDGVIDLYPDSIHLRTIPYGRQLKDVLMKLNELSKTASFISANFQEVSDISTGFEYGDIKLPLKRGVDPFAILDELKRITGFTARQSYIWNFTNMNGTLLPMTPFEIIAAWYHERCRSILGDLKYSRNDLFKQYRRLMALIVVADHTDEVLNIFKAANTREDTVKPLCDTFKLTETQAKYLASLQMHQITKQGKDTLLQELESVKDKIHNLQNKFTDIDNIIVTDAREIKQKYQPVTKRKLKLPNFIGALHLTGSGFIQFETLQELVRLTKRWSRREFKIILYPTSHTGLLVRDKDMIVSDVAIAHPKEFSAQDIFAYKYKPKHTIHLGNGLIFRTSDIYFVNEIDRKSLPVSEEFFVLDERFRLLQYRSTRVVKRQSRLAEGVKTDIRYISPAFGDSGVVVFVTDKYPNNLIFESVKVGDRMNFFGIGKPHIYGIYRPSDNFMLTLNQEHSYRCPIKHLYLPRISDILLNQDEKVTCSLNKKQLSNGIRLVQLDRNSDIWTYKQKEVT